MVALGVLCCLAGPAAAAPVRIDFPFFAGGEGIAFFEETARAFEAARPGVRVDADGDPRAQDKLRVRLLGGDAPSLTNAELPWYALARAGKLRALDDALDGPAWDAPERWRDTFLPGALDRYRIGGRVYGVPLFYSLYTFHYDKAFFEAHALAPPATWDDLFALAARIKALGRAPMAFQGRYHEYADGLVDAAYFHLAGRERYYAQKGLAAGGFDNAEYRQALQLVQRLAREAFQPGAMGMSHTDAQLELFAGRAAMVVCGSWLKSEMLGKIPAGFRLGAFNLPLPAAGSRADPTAVQLWASYYFVFADAPAETLDFLRFLTSRERAARFAARQDFPVAIRGANAGLSRDLDDVARLIALATSTYGEAAREGFPDFEQHRADVRYGLLAGRLAPEEAARQLESAASTVRAHHDRPDAITVRHRVKPLVLGGLVLLLGALAVRSAVRRLRTPRGRAQSIRIGAWDVARFLAPAGLLYAALVVLPSARTFALATRDWDGLGPPRPTGATNLLRLLLESDAFWAALGNSLLLLVVVPAVVLPIALFLAACLDRGVPGAGLFRVVLFFPNLLGMVAASLLFVHLLHPQRGPVNQVLVALGWERFRDFAWLAPDHLYGALIPLFVWSQVGLHMVLLLAAMQAVPRSLYEAAALDGASPARQFFAITLPGIAGPAALSAVLLALAGWKAFEVVWLLSNQQPATGVHTLATRMVQAMFNELHVGEAAAMAVVLFAVATLGARVLLASAEEQP